MNHRKKIYYLPGMVSLIAFPVVMLLSDFGSNPNERLRALEISWFRDISPPARQYTDIQLGLDEKSDDVKLAFVKVIASEMVAAKDSVHGLHIVFTDTTKYKSVVKAISDLNSIDVTCLPVKNEFWVWYRPIQKSTIAFEAWGPCKIKLVVAEVPPTYAEIFRKSIDDVWPMLAMFLILAVFWISWVRRLSMSYIIP